MTGWADLAGGQEVSAEATQVLPVVAPLLTRGQRWRADHAAGAAVLRSRRAPWLVELEEGQWRGKPPRGPLRLLVLGVSRSSTPGFVIVSGWRQFTGAEPKFCRVVVRADLVMRLVRADRSRRNDL